ncbi:hypothetical protein F2Q70_00003607 [Brassica cretica]|uniref:Uncharacterized protein n=1 Tax=Brassica cretica TaxID=69181 RepID=A0A8S9IR05_BRACR|nr:hypothetical protein F2Q70_00003607 [Brassica cretica]
MDSFTKRILRIPTDKPFEEAYFTLRLWMFFRETKETEEDIRRIFHQCALRYRIFSQHLTKCDGRPSRNLEVQIGNALVPVDFHVLDIKPSSNSSLLLGRAFMATVGAACDL